MGKVNNTENQEIGKRRSSQGYRQTIHKNESVEAQESKLNTHNGSMQDEKICRNEDSTGRNKSGNTDEDTRSIHTRHSRTKRAEVAGRDSDSTIGAYLMREMSQKITKHIGTYVMSHTDRQEEVQDNKEADKKTQKRRKIKETGRQELLKRERERV